jgi:predicted negative regulator of RcsB-dependent stress response
LYLTTGEVQMQQGNTEQARRALEQAADLGSPQVSDRAEALLEQL